jgi:beta-lactamase class A
MRPSRRHFVALSAASLWAAACSRQAPHVAAARFSDPAELSQGARALNARARPGLLDIGVMDVDHSRVWYADDMGHYPLVGLSKLLTAACALALVDSGRLRLNERLPFAIDDLSPPPSRINALFRGRADHQTINFPVADLIGLAMQHDDNTAGDAVLRRVGGPGAVTAWLRDKDLDGVRVDRYDRDRIPEMFGLGEFRPEWRDERGFAEALEAIPPAERQSAMDRYLGDPRDTATAPGMVGVLDKLAIGELLSAESTRFLLSLMSARPDAGQGVAAGLPAGSTFASAAASSHTSLGFTPAENEAGLVTLPGGRRLAIVVFLAGSTATAAARARLLADAGRLAATAS